MYTRAAAQAKSKSPRRNVLSRARLYTLRLRALLAYTSGGVYIYMYVWGRVRSSRSHTHTVGRMRASLLQSPPPSRDLERARADSKLAQQQWTATTTTTVQSTPVKRPPPPRCAYSSTPLTHPSHSIYIHTHTCICMCMYAISEGVQEGTGRRRRRRRNSRALLFSRTVYF